MILQPGTIIPTNLGIGRNTTNWKSNPLDPHNSSRGLERLDGLHAVDCLVDCPDCLDGYPAVDIPLCLGLRKLPLVNAKARNPKETSAFVSLPAAHYNREKKGEFSFAWFPCMRKDTKPSKYAPVSSLPSQYWVSCYYLASSTQLLMNTLHH